MLARQMVILGTICLSMAFLIHPSLNSMKFKYFRISPELCQVQYINGIIITFSALTLSEFQACILLLLFTSLNLIAYLIFSTDPLLTQVWPCFCLCGAESLQIYAITQFINALRRQVDHSRQLEAHLKSLSSLSEDIHFLMVYNPVTFRHNVVFASPNVQTRCGLDADHFVRGSRTFADLIHPADLEKVHKLQRVAVLSASRLGYTGPTQWEAPLAKLSRSVNRMSSSNVMMGGRGGRTLAGSAVTSSNSIMHVPTSNSISSSINGASNSQQPKKSSIALDVVPGAPSSDLTSRQQSSTNNNINNNTKATNSAVNSSSTPTHAETNMNGIYLPSLTTLVRDPVPPLVTVCDDESIKKHSADGSVVTNISHTSARKKDIGFWYERAGGCLRRKSTMPPPPVPQQQPGLSGSAAGVSIQTNNKVDNDISMQQPTSSSMSYSYKKQLKSNVEPSSKHALQKMISESQAASSDHYLKKHPTPPKNRNEKVDNGNSERTIKTGGSGAEREKEVNTQVEKSLLISKPVATGIGGSGISCMRRRTQPLMSPSAESTTLIVQKGNNDKEDDEELLYNNQLKNMVFQQRVNQISSDISICACRDCVTRSQLRRSQNVKRSSSRQNRQQNHAEYISSTNEVNSSKLQEGVFLASHHSVLDEKNAQDKNKTCDKQILQRNSTTPLDFSLNQSLHGDKQKIDSAINSFDQTDIDQETSFITSSSVCKLQKDQLSGNEIRSRLNSSSLIHSSEKNSTDVSLSMIDKGKTSSIFINGAITASSLISKHSSSHPNVFEDVQEENDEDDEEEVDIDAEEEDLVAMDDHPQHLIDPTSFKSIQRNPPVSNNIINNNSSDSASSSSISVGLSSSGVASSRSKRRLDNVRPASAVNEITKRLKPPSQQNSNPIRSASDSSVSSSSQIYGNNKQQQRYQHLPINSNTNSINTKYYSGANTYTQRAQQRHSHRMQVAMIQQELSSNNLLASHQKWESEGMSSNLSPDTIQPVIVRVLVKNTGVFDGDGENTFNNAEGGIEDTNNFSFGGFNSNNNNANNLNFEFFEVSVRLETVSPPRYSLCFRNVTRRLVERHKTAALLEAVANTTKVSAWCWDTGESISRVFVTSFYKTIFGNDYNEKEHLASSNQTESNNNMGSNSKQSRSKRPSLSNINKTSLTPPPTEKTISAANNNRDNNAASNSMAKGLNSSSKDRFPSSSASAILAEATRNTKSIPSYLRSSDDDYQDNNNSNNNNASKRTGEVSLETLFSSLQEPGRSVLQQSLANCRRRGVPYTVEVRHERNDGAVRWIRVSGGRVPGVGGVGSDLMWGLLHDVTKERLLERVQAQQRGWLQRLTDIDFDGWGLADLQEHLIIEASASLNFLVGRRQAGTPLSSTIPPQILWKLSLEGSVKNEAAILSHSDGSKILVTISAFIDVDDPGCLVFGLKKVDPIESQKLIGHFLNINPKFPLPPPFNNPRTTTTPPPINNNAHKSNKSSNPLHLKQPQQQRPSPTPPIGVQGIALSKEAALALLKGIGSFPFTSSPSANVNATSQMNSSRISNTQQQSKDTITDTVNKIDIGTAFNAKSTNADSNYSILNTCNGSDINVLPTPPKPNSNPLSTSNVVFNKNSKSLNPKMLLLHNNIMQSDFQKNNLETNSAFDASHPAGSPPILSSINSFKTVGDMETPPNPSGVSSPSLPAPGRACSSAVSCPSIEIASDADSSGLNNQVFKVPLIARATSMINQETQRQLHAEEGLLLARAHTDLSRLMLGGWGLFSLKENSFVYVSNMLRVMHDPTAATFNNCELNLSSSGLHGSQNSTSELFPPELLEAFKQTAHEHAGRYLPHNVHAASILDDFQAIFVAAATAAASASQAVSQRKPMSGRKMNLSGESDNLETKIPDNIIKKDKTKLSTVKRSETKRIDREEEDTDAVLLNKNEIDFESFRSFPLATKNEALFANYSMFKSKQIRSKTCIKFLRAKYKKNKYSDENYLSASIANDIGVIDEFNGSEVKSDNGSVEFSSHPKIRRTEIKLPKNKLSFKTFRVPLSAFTSTSTVEGLQNNNNTFKSFPTSQTNVNKDNSNVFSISPADEEPLSSAVAATVWAASSIREPTVTPTRLLDIPSFSALHGKLTPAFQVSGRFVRSSAHRPVIFNGVSLRRSDGTFFQARLVIVPFAEEPMLLLVSVTDESLGILPTIHSFNYNSPANAVVNKYNNITNEVNKNSGNNICKNEDIKNIFDNKNINIKNLKGEIHGGGAVSPLKLNNEKNNSLSIDCINNSSSSLPFGSVAVSSAPTTPYIHSKSVFLSTPSALSKIVSQTPLVSKKGDGSAKNPPSCELSSAHSRSIPPAPSSARVLRDVLSMNTGLHPPPPPPPHNPNDSNRSSRPAPTNPIADVFASKAPHPHILTSPHDPASSSSTIVSSSLITDLAALFASPPTPPPQVSSISSSECERHSRDEGTMSDANELESSRGLDDASIVDGLNSFEIGSESCSRVLSELDDGKRHFSEITSQYDQPQKQNIKCMQVGAHSQNNNNQTLIKKEAFDLSIPGNPFEQLSHIKAKSYLDFGAQPPDLYIAPLNHAENDNCDDDNEAGHGPVWFENVHRHYNHQGSTTELHPSSTNLQQMSLFKTTGIEQYPMNSSDIYHYEEQKTNEKDLEHLNSSSSNFTSMSPHWIVNFIDLSKGVGMNVETSMDDLTSSIELMLSMPTLIEEIGCSKEELIAWGDRMKAKLKEGLNTSQNEKLEKIISEQQPLPTSGYNKTTTASIEPDLLNSLQNPSKHLTEEMSSIMKDCVISEPAWLPFLKELLAVSELTIDSSNFDECQMAIDIVSEMSQVLIDLGTSRDEILKWWVAEVKRRWDK